MKRVWTKIGVHGFLIGIFCLGFSHAQEKYIDREGIVVFEASEKLFEPVKAKNESVSVIFDASNNKIASLALMRGFRFKNPLMQEHFNENYIESDQYPKAMFKGQIMDFDIDHGDSTTRHYTIKGTLEIRGTTKIIQPKVQIQKIGNVLAMHGSFEVCPGDFNIEIPKIVENKIAKKVLVKIDFKLTRAK